MSTACRCAAVVVFLFTLPTSATAGQSTAGEIQGVIVDGSGAPLPAATVTVTNAAAAVMRETFTDAAGFFAAPGLPAGSYEIQASAQGFSTARQSGVVLQAGQAITLRLELGVARAPETITIAATAPMVDATRSRVSSFISPTEIQHLPARTRDALELALTTPGVTLDITTGGASVLGQSGAFDRVLVDGAEQTRSFGAPFRVSQDATAGMEVARGAYTADYGRAAGAIAHVVTRSGSNELAASAFAYRGSAAGEGTLNQHGGQVGGPLVRDRHFGYAIYEGIRRSDGDAPFLLADEHNQHLFLGKTDHLLNDNHRLSLRYQSDAFDARRLEFPALDISSNAFTATALSSLGPALSNEARLHVARDSEENASGFDAAVTRVHFSDTLTWIRGAHKLKAGVDGQTDRVADAPATGLLAGAREPRIGEYSLFAQDEWRLVPNLTVNAGVRYDAQTFSARELAEPPFLPAAASTLPSRHDSVGPRLGVAWLPGGPRLLLRGGYGVVYGRTPWLAIAASNAFSARGLARAALVAFDASYENPRVHQASGGFEWEWMPNTDVSLDYLMLRGNQLPRVLSRGLIAGAGGPTRVIALDSSARLHYHGITAEMTRRFAQGHQYRIAYTLSDAESTMTNPLDTDRAWSVAPRHRLAASVILSSNRFADRFDDLMRTLVSDWTLSAIYSAQSGVPFGELEIPAWVSVDPRIARDITLKGDMRVTLVWEAFNLLDHDNYLMLNDARYGLIGRPLQPSALFGDTIAWIEPRSMQLAVRFSF
jgi:outer membrane receptor protein involved in Fe transport